MDDDANSTPLLSDAAKSDDKAERQMSYGSFEDLTDDYNRTARNGAGSQNGAADSYELASLEEKKKKSAVEDMKKPSKVDSEPTRKSDGLFFLAKGPGISDTDGPSTSGSHFTKVQSKEGEISFGMDEVEGVKTESSKYLRLSTTVKEGDIERHFMSMWVTPPELAVTFLGGCDEYFVSEKIKKCLVHCISNLLRKVQCCFITRGSNIGITKIIGRVCSMETLEWNYGFTSKSIGILPWQYVCGRKHLGKTESDEAVNYGSVAGNGSCRTEDDDFQLDPNQHYFYFVDEGNDDKSRVEVDFVSKLNMILSKDLIPCIILLCGGGVSSLRAVYEVFRQAKEDGTKPMLVIMKGSGKLADLLSSVLAYYQSNGEKNIDSAIEHASEASFKDLVDVIKENSTYKDMIHFCATDKIDQVLVFELESKDENKDDLQTVIFDAAKNAAKGFDKPQFLFAVNLGDVNLVKEMSRKSPYLAYNMMTKFITELESLSRAKELLEKCDFNVQSYVEERLLDLYKLVETDPRENPEKIRPRMATSEFDATELIVFYRRTYLKKVQDRSFLDIDKVMRDFSSGNTTLGIHTTLGRKIEVKKEIINPIQALLINSVLLLDINAAKLLWYFDQYNPLSNALLIYTLLKGIKSKTESVSKSSIDDFMEIQKYFESLMSSLLDAYFKTNKEMTEKVLKNKIPLWRNQSLIDVAGDIGQKSIIGKPGCQSVLAKRWKEVDDRTLCKSCCETRCTRIFAAPRIKLAIHVVVYLLTLFAVGVYVFYPNKSAREPIKWSAFVVMVSLTLDEVRQITDVGKSSLRNFKQWISSVWNIFDILAIAMFFVGFGVSYQSEVVSKYFFIFYLVLFCLKLLQFVTVWQSFGAYMVMIGKMFLRMWKFLVVVLVSVFGYGIFMTAMLFPEAKFNGEVLFHIFFRPYLILFGEPGIESFELSNTTTVFGTGRVSETSEAFVIVALAAFLLFANILLMNLLIADFSNIHGKILSQSDEHSRYEQYILLKEFEKKPLLPIPFSIFQNSYHLFRLCVESCRCRSGGNENIEIRFSDAEKEEKRKEKKREERERRKIADFEKYCFKKCFPKIPDAFDKFDHLVELT